MIKNKNLNFNIILNNIHYYIDKCEKDYQKYKNLTYYKNTQNFEFKNR